MITITERNRTYTDLHMSGIKLNSLSGITVFNKNSSH